MIKVRVIVKPDWVPDGEMYVINADQALVAYNPAPFLETASPAKIILVHDKIDEFRMCEAIREADDMELVDDDST